MDRQQFELFASKCPDADTIIGRRNLLHAAVILPFVESNGVYHLLFEKRAAHIPQGSEICFPGGEFEPATDSSLAQTALREAVEELGIEREKITLHGYIGTIIALRGIVVECYCATLAIAALDEINYDRSEVEQVFMLPVDYFIANAPEQYEVRVEMHPSFTDAHGTKKMLFPAQNLGLPQKYWSAWSGKNHRVSVYATPFGAIWGLTADILSEMVYVMSK